MTFLTQIQSNHRAPVTIAVGLVVALMATLSAEADNGTRASYAFRVSTRF